MHRKKKWTNGPIFFSRAVSCFLTGFSFPSMDSCGLWGVFGEK